MMEAVRLRLSALWTALMLTYLLGDVLRIFSGDFEAGAIGEMQASQGLYLGMAALLVMPAVMVFLSVTLKYRVNRLANIILSTFFTGIILITYAYYYVSGVETWAYSYVFAITEIILYALIVWYAWKWPR